MEGLEDDQFPEPGKPLSSQDEADWRELLATCLGVLRERVPGFMVQETALHRKVVAETALTAPLRRSPDDVSQQESPLRVDMSPGSWDGVLGLLTRMQEIGDMGLCERIVTHALKSWPQHGAFWRWRLLIGYGKYAGHVVTLERLEFLRERALASPGVIRELSQAIEWAFVTTLWQERIYYARAIDEYTRLVDEWEGIHPLCDAARIFLAALLKNVGRYPESLSCLSKCEEVKGPVQYLRLAGEISSLRITLHWEEMVDRSVKFFKMFKLSPEKITVIRIEQYGAAVSMRGEGRILHALGLHVRNHEELLCLMHTYFGEACRALDRTDFALKVWEDVLYSPDTSQRVRRTVADYLRENPSYNAQSDGPMFVLKEPHSDKLDGYPYGGTIDTDDLR